MNEHRENPLLKIEMFVQDHVTKEPANPDKPDTFEVSLKAPKDSFKIGMADANAKMKIKALDDIIKHNFPLYGNFRVEIYAIKKSVTMAKSKSVPTTLPEHPA
ncbi:MAG: hypothetical protein GX799_12300 [Crenarchaeota archaeon]|nr:hypothetical protein [Thermoproteota archaeon]